MIYNESYTSLEFIFKVFGKCGCRLNFPVAFWVTDSKYLNMLPMPVFTNSPHCQLSWFFPLKGFQVFDKSKYGQIPKYNHTFLITMNLKLKLNKLTRIFHLRVIKWFYILIMFEYSYFLFWWSYTNQTIIKEAEVFFWQTINWWLLTTFNACQGYFLYETKNPHRIYNFKNWS